MPPVCPLVAGQLSRALPRRPRWLGRRARRPVDDASRALLEPVAAEPRCSWFARACQWLSPQGHVRGTQEQQPNPVEPRQSGVSAAPWPRWSGSRESAPARRTSGQSSSVGKELMRPGPSGGSPGLAYCRPSHGWSTVRASTPCPWPRPVDHCRTLPGHAENGSVGRRAWLWGSRVNRLAH